MVNGHFGNVAKMLRKELKGSQFIVTNNKLINLISSVILLIIISLFQGCSAANYNFMV